MLIKKEVLTQPDGAHWEMFDVSGGKAVLTSKGKELFRERPQTWRDLRSYRKKAAGKKPPGKDPNIRRHFASGGNSDVYTAGEGLVMKEAKPAGGSLFFTVDRMDRLLNVIESQVPRWIDIPSHYGLLFSNNLERQYLLMQRIDSGVTVEHILNPGALTEDQATNLEVAFPGLSQGEQDDVRERFEDAGRILTSALDEAGYEPSSYLTDWHEGNVLVERLETPVADSPHKMWVIDQ